MQLDFLLAETSLSFRLPIGQVRSAIPPCRRRVNRGERKRAPLGKLEVSSLIRRELEAVGNVQRFARAWTSAIVCGDIQERKIHEGGEAENRGVELAS